jgi:hypothetical protein
MWRIWWAPNNASKWQTGFHSEFEGLKVGLIGCRKTLVRNYYLLHYSPEECCSRYMIYTIIVLNLWLQEHGPCIKTQITKAISAPLTSWRNITANNSWQQKNKLAALFWSPECQVFYYVSQFPVGKSSLQCMKCSEHHYWPIHCKQRTVKETVQTHIIYDNNFVEGLYEACCFDIKRL